MAADVNILKPGSGDPVVSANLLDIVLGVYWSTKEMKGELGEGKILPGANSAITAHDYGIIGLRSMIKIKGNTIIKSGGSQIVRLEGMKMAWADDLRSQEYLDQVCKYQGRMLDYEIPIREEYRLF